MTNSIREEECCALVNAAQGAVSSVASLLYTTHSSTVNVPRTASVCADPAHASFARTLACLVCAYSQVLATVSPSFSGSSPYGNNVLQPAVFWSLFQLDARVQAINVSSGGRTLTWTDVCALTYQNTCKYAM